MKPLLAGLLAFVDAPNVNVPLGVVVPDAGADEAAVSEEAGLGAPKENVDAGAAAGFDSGAGLLPVLAGAPNVNPPAGFDASAVVDLGAPKLKPPEADEASAGLAAPKPPLLVLLSVEGLPNVNPPVEAGAASLGASSPLAPKKLGTPLLGFAVVASSFFSAAVAADGAPKLNPEEAGAEAWVAGCGVAGAPNEKLGMLFLAAGSASSSAPRFDPVEAADVDGAPKLKPPILGELDEAPPKIEGLLAGADSSFFSVLAPKEPNGLLAGAEVGADSAAGLPKLNGAGLLAAASLPDAVEDVELPKEKPPLGVEEAGAGASPDLLSSFFMVLPKKLGTGPSFLPSLSDFEAGSAGLLKKSDVDGATGFFAALSSCLGAVLAPKVNLGVLSAVPWAGAEKENDGAVVAALGASFFSLASAVAAEESKPPRRPSSELPLAVWEAGSGAAAGLLLAVALAVEGVAAELPNEKPDGNMLVGNLIFASSLALGRSSSSSSSSHALNFPEL